MAKNRTFTFFAAVALLMIAESGHVQAQKKKAAADATAHNAKGIEFLQQGANDQAVLEFTQAIESSPKDFRIYKNRAKALRAAQKIPEALADFTKAIELAPTDPDAYSERGATLVVQNQVEPGMADLNKALELKPNDPLTLERRGLAHYKLKNYEASLADLDNAVLQNPTSVKALNQRADTLVAMNQLEKAAADLEAVLKLKSDDFSAEDRLQNVRSRLAKPAAAPVVATPPPTPTPKPPLKLLTRTNIFIAIGAFLLVGIIVVFVAKALATRSTD